MMRWTPNRKHRLISMYHAGRAKEVSAELRYHDISRDEFMGWLARDDAMGLDGLKVSKIKRVA